MEVAMFFRIDITVALSMFNFKVRDLYSPVKDFKVNYTGNISLMLV